MHRFVISSKRFCVKRDGSNDGVDENYPFDNVTNNGDDYNDDLLSRVVLMLPIRTHGMDK